MEMDGNIPRSHSRASTSMHGSILSVGNDPSWFKASVHFDGGYLCAVAMKPHAMRKILDRYYGRLRKLKINYVLLNLLSGKKLTHARRMYRKYGVQRSVLLPISSQHLPSGTTEQPWLDTPEGVAALPGAAGLKAFNADTQAQLLQWPAKGYLILRGLFSANEVHAINAEVDRLVQEKVVDFNFTGRKIMFAFHHSELLRKYVHDRRILDVMDFLLGKRMRVFQSINFLTGSEQAAHSDSIHMTTHPLGYMT